jgi:hypothetical protein
MQGARFIFEEVLAKLKSIGKLTELLENDFPYYEEVDQAVQEHVKLLQKLDLTPQEPEAEEENPPSVSNT